MVGICVLLDRGRTPDLQRVDQGRRIAGGRRDLDLVSRSRIDVHQKQESADDEE